MKKTIRKISATSILLICVTFNVLAECQPPTPQCGDMQCPCLLESTVKNEKSEKYQTLDLISDILKILEKTGIFF